MENDVVIFEYHHFLKMLCLECNRRTRPQVVFIERRDFPGVERRVWKEEEAGRQLQMEELDALFSTLRGRLYRAEWCPRFFFWVTASRKAG